MTARSIAPTACLGGVLAFASAVATPAQAQVAAALTSGPPIWIISVVGAVFAGVIGIMGTIALKTLRAARASRSWPVAAGAVLSGDIQEVEERDHDGDTSIYYVPRLRYAHEVAGRSYESERIRFGNIRESQKGARKILERYAVGSPVEVRYDPANPSQATLETKAGGVGLMLFAVVVLALLFAYMASVFLG